MILPRRLAGEGDPEGVEGAMAVAPLDFAPSTSFAGPPPPFATRVGRIH